MSRILKRPMFRRGGKVNQGIMSGLVDRTNYENGAFGNMTEDQIRSNIDMLTNLQNQFAPVAKTRLPLGDVGLALIAGQSPIDALATGYKKFTSEDDKRRALLDKRISAAVSTVLSQALKQEKDTKTAAIKNALAQGLIPGTKKFNDYITAATIKGAGLQIKFDAEGRPIVTQGNIPEDKERTAKANDILSTTFKLNNAGNSLVNELKGAKVGAVGTIINALDSAGSQISQAAQAFGVGQKSNLDLSEGTTQIDNYLEEKFGSALANDAIKFGKIKSVSINLAYLMAKADEPGGRFTDRDIALKMEELGLGANQNLNFDYKNLTKKDIDFSDINAVGSFALGLQESTKDQKTESEPDVGLPEYKFINGVLHVKKGDKFEPVKAK